MTENNIERIGDEDAAPEDNQTLNYSILDREDIQSISSAVRKYYQSAPEQYALPELLDGATKLGITVGSTAREVAKGLAKEAKSAVDTAEGVGHTAVSGAKVLADRVVDTAGTVVDMVIDGVIHSVSHPSHTTLPERDMRKK